MREGALCFDFVREEALCSPREFGQVCTRQKGGDDGCMHVCVCAHASVAISTNHQHLCSQSLLKFHAPRSPVKSRMRWQRGFAPLWCEMRRGVAMCILGLVFVLPFEARSCDISRHVQMRAYRMELRGGGEELDPEYAKALQDRQVCSSLLQSQRFVCMCCLVYVCMFAKLHTCVSALCTCVGVCFPHNAHFVLYPQT